MPDKNEEIEKVKATIKLPVNLSPHELEKYANKNKKTSVDNIELYRKKRAAEGESEFFEMRKKWSIFIKEIIRVLIWSQVILILLMGFGRRCGWFNVLDYKTIILTFFAETFVQIIGLAILVVKYLFKEKNSRIAK
ncbi:MAG: hypothetical protein LBT58_03230 [Endomicrobium sp.]|jgi:hypothetical protein|nr:hypothetical protein [Endomicrobium sp.]